MRRRAAAAAGLAAALILATRPAGAWVTDAGTYPPVDHATFRPPAAGEGYIDPAFGSFVRRLSDATATPDAANGGTLPLVNNEYATIAPFNRDNGYLILGHHSYFALYDGEGRYLRDLPFDIHGGSEPRWSRALAARLYYINGNQLKRYDVDTGDRGVVRTFPEYADVRGNGESDIAFQDDRFVLVGDGRDIFVYDVATDTKGAVLETAGLGGFDNVFITPDDNVLVGWYARGTGRYEGVELYDREMNFLRQVSRTVGHMDVTRDLDGGEVLLLGNASDPAPVCPSAIVKIRLSDGAQTCLLQLDWSVAVHVSGTDEDGWAVVSTYVPSDPVTPDGWKPYAGEILQVRLDGTQVRRLAHHRSRPFNDYAWQPRAAVSRDGSRLVYSSNYGLPGIDGYPATYGDAYLIDLTATGPAPAGSDRPLRRGFGDDDEAVLTTGAWFVNRYPGHNGGRALFAAEAGARALFVFTGSSVRWFGYRDEWSGIARVHLDGVLLAEVDTYAPSGQAQALLHAVDGLALGVHTLTIEATGRANRSSGGAWVWVDGFEVAARHEQDTPLASYGGGWLTNRFPRHSGGTAVLGMDAGMRAVFQFTGTGVSWIGYRDEWSGIARVFIDGVLRAELDTHATPAREQAVIYTLTGLGPGPHVLAIEATRSKSVLSEGAWVWVDGFEVLP